MRRSLRSIVVISLPLLLLACQEEIPIGHPGFASPHASPLALSPTQPELYVANTAADTLEVIDTTKQKVMQRISVGIDPVSVAVRPDGLEVWVANHVSDSVSIIDVAPGSPTRYRVVGTVQAFDAEGQVTTFDEPVGIAFANDAKAYVALSSRNAVAIVDVATRSVTGEIFIPSQEPRALAVRGGRLFVLPFESGNRTELSGCLIPAFEPGCTFSIAELQSNSIDIILTRNLVADIIRNPATPDRDLLVFDTADESPVAEVSAFGTLLYGLAVDSQGDVLVALTEARNDANGLSGTAGHGLAEIENRMFLNQVARVNCSAGCDAATLFDLEPLPPSQPAPGMALSTPFGIQVSDDDATVVAVAAGSSKLFTMDAATGQVLGRADVGAIPRGLVLASDGGGQPAEAWVFNAVDASVSRVDVSDPTAPIETKRIALDDPTHPDVKAGRIAFNDANGSTTGTFSCASCHPDGNTDQLLWNLGAVCLTPGCNQAQPRTTMPIRGLRDTLPLHWDGVVGDPFGGINAEVADSGVDVPPDCTDEHSCFRALVDGAMSGTMCDQGACPDNGEGLAGAFSIAERDAMAVFLRSVPYPPARERRLDDTLSPQAFEGFQQFLKGVDEDFPVGCSRTQGACHALPFWAGTNTPQQGMDAPTFRGIPDRHLLLPNGRSGMWGLISLTPLNAVQWDPLDGPDELYSWGMTFGTEDIPLVNRNSLGDGPFKLFQLFLEGSMGFAGSFGRQVTLDANTAGDPQTTALLAALERADDDGVVLLGGKGTKFGTGGAIDLSLIYDEGLYAREGDDGSKSGPFTRQELLDQAAAGEITVTFTGRIGANSDVDHPQPAIWLPSRFPQFGGQSPPALPVLTTVASFTVFGRHVVPGAGLLVDGQAVDGTVQCELGGTLPACTDEVLRIDLAALPPLGDHTFQVTTPGGLLSNEMLIEVH